MDDYIYIALFVYINIILLTTSNIISLTGSERIKQLTIEERAEYAQKGAFLEDEIYLLRDQLADIETKMLNGDIDIDRRVIQDLRDELNALKDDYINLVGAHDLPLYFGKAGSPDSYQ